MDGKLPGCIDINDAKGGLREFFWKDRFDVDVVVNSVHVQKIRRRGFMLHESFGASSHDAFLLDVITRKLHTICVDAIMLKVYRADYILKKS